MKINFSSARGYIFSAALYLKHKEIMKPKKLANYLGCSRTRAGRILRILEWVKLNQNSTNFTNPTYVPKGSALL